MIQNLRRMARRNRAWVSLRRAQREGWYFTFQKLQTWPRILRLAPVCTAASATKDVQCEVHLLCSQGDYLSAIWALKSFFTAIGNVALPLTIHFDTNLPPKVRRRLSQHFPDARIVDRAQADAVVAPILEKRKLFRVVAARAASPFILKLTDFALLSDADNIISFDSDVIFFSKPTELLQASRAPFDGAFVQRDLGSVYNITSEQAIALGWKLPERVNTGIMAFTRSSVDLDACDQLLADSQLARPTGWIEQTLFALLFERAGQLRFLPPTYLIPVAGDASRDSDVVARHYAGESRPLLTLQGMPRFLVQQTTPRDRNSV